MQAYSQSTFSTIVDLKIGSDNLSRDIILLEEEICVLSKHRCGDNNDKLCGSFSFFDYDGNLKSVKAIEDIHLGGRNCLLEKEDGSYVLSGHLIDPDRKNGIDLVYFDDEFNQIDTYDYDLPENVFANNRGMIEFDGAYYLYGNKPDYIRDTSYGHIIKIDASSHEKIWDYEWQTGGNSASVFDLQVNGNNNLVFYGESGRYDYDFPNQIVELDTAGQVLNTFDIPNMFTSQSSRMVLDDESNMIFTFDYSLIENNYGNPNSSTTVHKLSSDFKTLEWVVDVPKKTKNLRSYSIIDFLISSDGNIVFCGTVTDLYESDDDRVSDHGFLCQITPEGKMDWLRLYKHPNPNIDADEKEYYLSALYHLRELEETGRFIVSGVAGYLTPDIQLKSESWLLSTDSKGCLNGEECEEVIIVDELNSSRKDITDFHNLWIYDGLINPSFPQAKYISLDYEPIRFNYSYNEILMKDKEYDNWQKTDVLIREEFGKVWRKRPQNYNLEYLLYDFNLETGDEMYTRDFDENWFKIVIIKVDYIQMENGNCRKRLFVRCKDDPKAPERIWIEGIGDVNGLLAVQSTCMSDDSIQSQLTSFHTSCDTIFINENVVVCEEVVSEETVIQAKAGIDLFPNPVNAPLNIELKNAAGIDVKIFSLLGQEVFSQQFEQRSTLFQLDLGELSRGTYFVYVLIDGEVLVDKIIMP